MDKIKLQQELKEFFKGLVERENQKVKTNPLDTIVSNERINSINEIEENILIELEKEENPLLLIISYQKVCNEKIKELTEIRSKDIGNMNINERSKNNGLIFCYNELYSFLLEKNTEDAIQNIKK